MTDFLIFVWTIHLSNVLRIYTALLGGTNQKVPTKCHPQFRQLWVHSLAWSDMRFDGKGFLCAVMLQTQDATVIFWSSLRVLFNAVSNISHMVSRLSGRQTGTHIKRRAWTLAALHNDTFRGLEPLIKAQTWKGAADREESRRKANEMESSRLSGKECGSVLPLVHVCTWLWSWGGLTYIISNCVTCTQTLYLKLNAFFY